MTHTKLIKELAYEILEKEQKPLHYKEITRIIQKKRKLTGKTPWLTVNARLCTNPKFKRVGKGIYALSEWG